MNYTIPDTMLRYKAHTALLIHKLRAACTERQKGSAMAATQVKDNALKSLFLKLEAQSGEIAEEIGKASGFMPQFSPAEAGIFTAWMDQSLFNSSDDGSIISVCKMIEKISIDIFKSVLDESDLSLMFREKINAQVEILTKAYMEIENLLERYTLEK